MIAQAIRFSGVGILGTLCHVLVAFAASAMLPVTALVANFVGFSAAVALSYVGHARFTFDVAANHSAHLPRFAASALVGLLVSSLITLIVHDIYGGPFWAALGLTAITVPPVTFVVLKLWVFAPDKREHSRTWIGVVLSAAVAISVLALFWNRIISHDVVWYLIATRRWLDGAALYTDIVEINPPLNFYLTVPPVWLAEATGLSPTNAQYVVFCALLFLCLSWCWAIVSKSRLLTLSRQIGFLLLLAFALIVPAYANLVQRDHIMLLFVLPWLFGHMLPDGAQCKTHVIGRALFAAIGICLKPHFVVMPLFVTLWEMQRDRAWRPAFSASNWTFFACGIAYIAFTGAVHPEYFRDIVPLGRAVYGAYGFDAYQILWCLGTIPLFIAISLLLARKGVQALGLFASAAAAGLASYLLQWTGFIYQAIPFVALSSIALAWVIVNSSMASGLKSAFPALSAAFTLMVIAQFYLSHGTYDNRIAVALAKEIPDSRSVASVSTYVHVGPSVAMEADALWASRYPALWLVPGAVNGLMDGDCADEPDRCAKLTAIANASRTATMDDLATFAPDAIIFDSRPGYIRDPSFTWQGYMAQEPRYAAFMRGYEIRRTLGYFEIWVRKPDRMETPSR